MLDNLTLVAFTAHLNSSFKLTLGPDQMVDLLPGAHSAAAYRLRL